MDKLKELLNDCEALMELINDSGLGGTDAADAAIKALGNRMILLIKAAVDFNIGDVSDDYPWLEIE